MGSQAMGATFYLRAEKIVRYASKDYPSVMS